MHNTTHSVIEDIFALVSAGLFVAFGVFLFQSQDLMVGGAAGLALLGTYAVDMDFGLLFFLINLPFYTLAWTQISKRFTFNTFISVTTVSILTEQIPAFVDISHINPFFAAIFEMFCFQPNHERNQFRNFCDGETCTRDNRLAQKRTPHTVGVA